MLRTHRTLLRFGKRFHSAYDGTAYTDQFAESYRKDIEPVKLAFEKHSSPGSQHDKSSIIFAHGLFGSKMNNRTVSKTLASVLKRDVYCVDLRNHGDSPHNERHDYPALSSDLELFVKDHKLEKPILIGHSMGAKAAMAFALRNPTTPFAIISVDNAPVDASGGQSQFGKYVNCLQQIVSQTGLNAIKTTKEADAKLSQVEPDIAVRQFLLTNLRRKSKCSNSEPGLYSKIGLDFVGKSLDSVAAFPFDPRASTWSGPALFIRGDRSPFVSDEKLLACAAFFPRFEIKDVHDAGHWVISEKPQEFVRLVTEWINLLDDGSLEDLL
ncbi:hypothetical protein LJB42_004414 [Komagataella kurtzmanii]|nr:hypothetical protein LJB42_004414 [Komagataella kurtzmanii]